MAFKFMSHVVSGITGNGMHRLAAPPLRPGRPCKNYSFTVYDIAGSKRTASSAAITYNEFGDLSRVLQKTVSDAAGTTTELADDCISIEMLAAPINPADVNQIQGVYPIKPHAFPATGGNEGVGRVLAVGSGVKKQFQIGQLVLATPLGKFGTWQQYLTAPASDFLHIKNQNIPIEAAATLSVNPGTAYRMLHDFVPDMQPGDAVLQNGANSAVGLYVIQLAREMNLQTINVIRGDRPDFDELKSRLEQMGATYVISDKDLNKRDQTSKLPKAKLALNCVGGKAAGDMTRLMLPKSVHVTYGGMSKMPVLASTASLIFQDIHYRGFWISSWKKQQEGGHEKFQEMVDHLSDLISQGKLIGPRFKPFRLAAEGDEWKDAIELAQKEKTSVKPLIVMNDEVFKQIES